MSRRNGKTIEIHKEFMDQIAKIRKDHPEETVKYVVYAHPDTRITVDLYTYLEVTKLDIVRNELITKGQIIYAKKDLLDSILKPNPFNYRMGIDYSNSDDITTESYFIRNNEENFKMLGSRIVLKKEEKV